MCATTAQLLKTVEEVKLSVDAHFLRLEDEGNVKDDGVHDVYSQVQTKRLDPPFSHLRLVFFQVAIELLLYLLALSLDF